MEPTSRNAEFIRANARERRIIRNNVGRTIGEIRRYAETKSRDGTRTPAFIRKVAGGISSMAPTINAGNTVLSVGVDSEADIAKLKVGDIIIFRHPTLADIGNVCHRIVGIEKVGGEYQFKTKGDNLPEPDQQMVPEKNVRDLVVGVIWKTPVLKEFDLSVESAMKLIEKTHRLNRLRQLMKNEEAR